MKEGSGRVEPSIRFSTPFEDKAEGWIFLNGNVAREEDLVNMCREQILNPQHTDPKTNESKKVLLVTAAFEKGHEHQDRHLISMFERLSIDARWDGQFPRNIQNLSVYSMFNEFRERERWLHQKYTEKQDQIKAVKYDYLMKNSHYMEVIHRLSKDLESRYPNLTMFDFYNITRYPDEPRLFLGSLSEGHRELAEKELGPLARSKTDIHLCRELRETLDHLIYKDNEIFYLCEQIEKYFLERSGVMNSALYQEQRAELAQRILTSASIFIFGGRVRVLVNRLRFYRLNEVFKEALKRGTNVFGISAGSLCQTDRYYMSFQRFTPGGYLRAEDSGMGLTSGLWIFPHAEDYNYFREADRDALCFFTLRHRDGVVVGLCEKSILLCEKYRDPVDGKVYRRFTSIGDHPVLVFGEKGIKREMKKFSQLILEGTKFYKGKNQLADQEDIEQMEHEALEASSSKAQA